MLLVSILGDFHSSILPIYNQFKDNISNHIIIYDDFKSEVDEAKNIIKGIKAFNKKNNLNIKTHTYCVDEDNYDALLKAIVFIKKHIKKDKNFYINTTDGLSNINTIIALELLPFGAKLISYDRYDNEVNILDNKTMNTYKIDKTISIKDHFLLRNIDIETVNSKKEAKKYKNEIIQLFEVYPKEFKEFTRYLHIDVEPKLDNKKFKNINKILKKFNFKDLNSQQSFITGTLFEYYIYLKIKHLVFDDIQLGITVKKYIDYSNFLPNEFDILIMKDNHLHMIECKFTKNIKLDSLVYKYMGLKSLLDDDGKICIVTTHDNPKNLHNSTNPIEYQPHKRALENKILLKGNPLENIDKFVNDIKVFFKLYDE